jgi:hypothetical protein
MAETEQMLEALDARVRRREERRAFFKAAIGAAAVGGFAVATAAQAQTLTDNDVFNFALNLEYLEANFYSYAVFGTPLDPTLTTGTVGAPGVATGGHAVPFSDPLVAQYAREIATNEITHVRFLRSVLGGAAIAQPQIDVSVSPTSAFSLAAQSAGVVAAGTAFDPYASDENFLLGAYLFEDVGVTAYKGASPLLTNKTYIEAAAGILAVEAYHAAILRTTLYRKGMGTPAIGSAPAIPAQPALITNAGKISDARDLLDGSPAEDLIRGIGPDDDQGIAGTSTTSNIAPLNANGLAFSRSAAQALNIVYLNRTAVTMGGFFPRGVNGAIKTSAAN